MKMLIALGFILLAAGCYSAIERQKELAVEKKEAWVRAHPGEALTPEIEGKLVAEAIAEEQAERKADLSKAKTDLAGAAGAAATGNWVGAGILIIGAIGTFFGLSKKSSVVKVKPPESPPTGGVA